MKPTLSHADISESEEIAREVAKQYPRSAAQQLELLRLARIGIDFELHSVAIIDALKLVIGELPISKISRFEKALDTFSRRK
jgi:hypothetical protein